MKKRILALLLTLCLTVGLLPSSAFASPVAAKTLPSKTAGIPQTVGLSPSSDAASPAAAKTVPSKTAGIPQTVGLPPSSDAASPAAAKPLPPKTASIPQPEAGIDDCIEGDSFLYGNSRIEISCMLYKAAGEPEADLSYESYEDLTELSEYEQCADAWAWEHLLFRDLDISEIGLESPVTRAEAVMIIWRAFGSPTPTDDSCPFSDVNSWYNCWNAVLWAVQNEWIDLGVFDSEQFRPDSRNIVFRLTSYSQEDSDAVYWAVALEHEHEWEETDRDGASCTGGTIWYRCAVCGEEKSEEYEASTEHDWQETDRDGASCVGGTIWYRCASCGEEKTEEYEATTDHNWEETGRDGASCVGGTVWYFCFDCCTEKSETYAPYTDHHWEEVNREGSDEAGWQVWYSCSMCGQEDYHEYPADTVHDWVETDRTGFPCTGGDITYTCMICGDWYREYYEPYEDHSWEESERDGATCTGGTIVYTCEACGEQNREWYEATTDHNWQETERSGFSCTGGTITYVCSLCGEWRYEDYEATAEHSWQETDRSGFSCTGGTISYTCGRCGEWYNEDFEAYAEHSWEEFDRHEPTIFDEGFVRYTCSRCGEYREEVLPVREKPEGTLRVVLTWGSTPPDLDSHLKADDGSFEVFYGNMSHTDDNVGVYLDVDDTSSYGPETTLICPFNKVGSYTFFIHDYTNGSNSSSTALAHSGALVKVYRDERLVESIPVPVDGFTGTDWQVFRYNAATGEIERLSNGTGTLETDFTVPGDSYGIRVVDHNGNPLQNAKILWETASSGEEVYTDFRGIAFVPRLIIGTARINISCDGYLPWTNENSDWSPSEEHRETVILYPESYGPYMLASALYSNHSDMSHSTNLLVNTKKISLGNDAALVGDLDLGNFYLKVRAIDPAKAAKYELYQNDTLIASCTDGNFGKLNTDRFSEGSGCKVVVTGTDGSTAATRINLVFSKEAINDALSLSFNGKTLTFKVPDNIPFLGGKTFNLDIRKVRLPIIAEVSSEKIKLGVNVNIFGEDDKETQIDKAKDLIEGLRKAAGMKLSKKDANVFNSLVKDKNKFNFLGKDCLEFNFLGYGEYDYGSKQATITLMLLLKIDALSWEYNVLVSVVPVTIQVGLEVNASGYVTGSYDFAKSVLTAALETDVKPKLEVFGGVGVSKYIGVGAYGSAELAWKLHLLAPPIHTKSLDLTGELGLKAYAGPFTYQRPFAYNTWHLYTANNVRRPQTSDQSTVPWQEELRKASSYGPDDLSYLYGESAWRGQTASPAGTQQDAQEIQSWNHLLENTYRNSRPEMISGGDALYAAFIRANPDTGSRYAVVTRFDGNGWTTPAAADPNAVLDNSVTLCAAPDGTLLMAYASTGESDLSSLYAYGQAQRISAGVVDKNTMQFTQSSLFEGSFVHSPVLCSLGDSVYLFWADSDISDDDSVLAPSVTRLCYSVWNSGAWSEPTVLCTVDSPMQSYVPGLYQGRLAAACDTDAGLLLLDGANRVVLTEEVIGKLLYTALPGMEPDFVWNTETALQTASGFSMEVSGMNRELSVTQEGIYYSAMDNTGLRHLAKLPYHADSGQWGSPVCLTNDTEYLENLSVATLNGRDYVLGMLVDASIREESVIDSKDLVWSDVCPVHDLSIEDLDYQAADAVPGTDVPILLTAANLGDCPVSALEILVDDLVVETKTVALAPGEEVELTFAVPCGESFETHRISVREPNYQDRSPENNSWELNLGLADAALSLQYQQIGEGRFLTLAVDNLGVAPADGLIRLYDGSGELAIEYTFSQLQRGEQTVSVYEIPLNFAGRDSGDIQAEVILEGQDVDLSNNRVGLHIGEPAQAEAHVHELEYAAPVSPGCVQNGTGEYWFCKLCGQFFGDPDAAAELESEPGVAPLGHLAGDPVEENYVEPTIYADGGYDTVIYCTRCSMVVSRAHTVLPAVTPVNPFTDVRENSYYYDAILWGLYHAPRITAGVSDSSFAPNRSCTRAQVLTFLWRMMGCPEPELTLAQTDFRDVKAGSWYEKAVRWAVEEAITYGTGTGTFSPEQLCTRAQTVTLIWRALGSPEPIQPRENEAFWDVSADSWYTVAVYWAAEKGITLGTGAHHFSPNTVCSRAQAITLLWRAGKLLPPDPDADYAIVAKYDFETDPELSGWTLLDRDGDGFNWAWNQSDTAAGWFSSSPDYASFAYEGSGCILSGSYLSTVGALTPDNWAVSPAFSLSRRCSHAYVSLYAKGQDPSWEKERFVLYAGSSPQPESMQPISNEFVVTGEYVQYLASLDAFLGEPEVYIAVRHCNVTDMYILNLDQVEIRRSLN